MTLSLSKESRFAFPKSTRILKNTHYRQVVKFGDKRVGRYVIVHSQFLGRGSGAKVGITVSRKFGKAVARNLFKRRVREAFRTIRGDLSSDLHCVVKARPLAHRATFSSLKAELKYLLI